MPRYSYPDNNLENGLLQKITGRCITTVFPLHLKKKKSRPGKKSPEPEGKLSVALKGKKFKMAACSVRVVLITVFWPQLFDALATTEERHRRFETGNKAIADGNPTLYQLRGAWRDRDTNNIFDHCSLIFYFLDFKFSNFVCPSELHPLIWFFF